MKNGVLYRHREDAGCVSQQIVVPKAARSQILKHLHEGAFNGHLGEAKTLGRLCERFYCPDFQKMRWNGVRLVLLVRLTRRALHPIPLHPNRMDWLRVLIGRCWSCLLAPWRKTRVIGNSISQEGTFRSPVNGLCALLNVWSPC